MLSKSNPSSNLSRSKEENLERKEGKDKISRDEEEGEGTWMDIKVEDPIPEEQADPSPSKENTDSSSYIDLRAILDDSDSDSD